MTATNPLPPAVVVLDHSNPVDFEREAMPLLGTLMIDYLRAEAARSKQTDTGLMRVALGARPDLGSDVANAAGALLAARNDALSVWPEADLARAVGTLQELAAA